MPFDNKLYDGIFCHTLIHLLSKREKKKFINDCYNQLKPDGYMIFTAVSKEAQLFGKGKQLGKDRFETMKGVKILFYDFDSVKREFREYGFTDTSEIDEPAKNKESKPPVQISTH